MDGSGRPQTRSDNGGWKGSPGGTEMTTTPCSECRQGTAPASCSLGWMTAVLGPIERGQITTLIGTPGTELLVLTVALALSYRTGAEIVPGWQPIGSGEVDVVSYEGPSWCAWRSIEQDICDAAGITAPVINFVIRNLPYYVPPPPSEPIARAFFIEAAERDDQAAETIARATGRTRLPSLEIVYGLGIDGSPQRYRELQGKTALFIGAETFFLMPSQTEGAQWAGTYGPIARLSHLRDTDNGLSEFLERTVARVEPLPGVDRLAHRAADIPRGDAEAFFDWQGIEAIRAILVDGRSEESQRVKALARDHGITPGTLYRVATQFARDASIPVPPNLAATGHAPRILVGYAATWDWFEWHGTLHGNYLERFVPGCFARTLAEDRDFMSVRFCHGWDRRFADTPLGPISVLEEDEHGLRYEVTLLDNPHNRELEPWLATGLYGSSSRTQILADAFVKSPGESSHNPRGIPEREILEVRMQEFGPGYPPRDPGTSAAIR